MNVPEPDAKAVHQAARRIAPHIIRTPVLWSPVLDALTGGRILLKAENLQTVGAFKIRGALNRIMQIDPSEFPGGVVAYSSGNHAQGVASAARLSGLAAMIVMPTDAPAMKIERTRSHGAEVHLYDRNSEDRAQIAQRLADERQAAIVPPFDHPDIIAGQGTVGLELMEQAAGMGLTPDAVVVPCSGGGLASGVALAVKDVAPRCAIHTVEPVNFDDFARSLETGRPQTNQHMSGSICDALLSPTPGKLTFDIGRQLFAAGLSISDDEAAAAVAFAFRELKLVLEPGGAVALAAVLGGHLPVRNRTVACILSGGNVDPGLFSRLILT